MIKLVYCLCRRPGMSREDFQAYWFDRHAPLVKAHAESLGIARYVQVHTQTGALSDGIRASRGAPEAYDGVAELWFDDDAFANPRPGAADASRILEEDEAKFIDFSKSPVFFAVERPIITGDA